MSNSQQPPDELSEIPAPYQAVSSQTDPDVDLSLLEDSLRLTPWQRLVENDRALGLVRMLEEAGKRMHGAPD